MAILSRMPAVVVRPSQLLPFGERWSANGGKLSRTPPNSSSQLGHVFDEAVGRALSLMLGNVPVVPPINADALVAPEADCVEVGPTRIIGGIRAQNFDVCYRPDGIRFTFDSKTLNDAKSVQKNYQNMINDLATEATTVHTRFPYAIVGFMVVIPKPCLSEPQRSVLIRTLDRLAKRVNVTNLFHLAEAISLVVWHPETGDIDAHIPPEKSKLRIENFSGFVETAYLTRYEGFPPHG